MLDDDLDAGVAVVAVDVVVAAYYLLQREVQLVVVEVGAVFDWVDILQGFVAVGVAGHEAVEEQYAHLLVISVTQ